MTTTRLSAIPATLTAGDTVAITLTVADYAAPVWSLSWALAGPDVLTLSSTANGSGHDLTVSAVQTAALAAGLYQWRVRASDGTEVNTVSTGTLTVVADLAVLSAGEAVSWDAQTLTVLQASISGSLAANMADFMIDGRRVTEIPLAERIRLIAWLETRIAMQRHGGRLPPVLVGRWTPAPSADTDGWR